MRDGMRSWGVVLCSAAFGLAASLASAQTAAPPETPIYIDQLAPGWSISGWAKNTPQKAIDNGMKPVLLQMQAYSNLGFKSDKPINLKDFKTLTFAVYLDGHGRQEVYLQAKIGGKDASKKLVLKGPKQHWFEVDLATSDLHLNKDGLVDEINFANPGGDQLEDVMIDNVALQ